MTRPERPPYSDLASPEAAAQSRATEEVWDRVRSAMAGAGTDDVTTVRAIIDDLYLRPGLERLRARFPVTIESEQFGGVRTDVVLPAAGVAPENAGRVLVNLHGGGLRVAAGLGGQQESVPIAALGRIRVVTVDYRMSPEWTFPAASEDVAAVYRALLADHPPESIGVYGCSSGGYLTAAAIAWFESVGLPRPGAIGVFGTEAAVGVGWGDSLHTTAFLSGQPVRTISPGAYFDDADLTDPRVSPALHPDLLSRFPPTLLVSGSRDVAFSPTIHFHAQLVKAGVDARLHVWEGAEHCAFAQGVVDPDQPETREAWDVVVRFFDRHLAVPGGRPSREAS